MSNVYQDFGVVVFICAFCFQGWLCAAQDSGQTATCSAFASDNITVVNMCQDFYTSGSSTILLGSFDAGMVMPPEGAAQCKCTFTIDQMRERKREMFVITRHLTDMPYNCGTQVSIESSSEFQTLRCSATARTYNPEHFGPTITMTLSRDAIAPPSGYGYGYCWSIYSSDSRNISVACTPVSIPTTTQQIPKSTQYATSAVVTEKALPRPQPELPPITVPTSSITSTWPWYSSSSTSTTWPTTWSTTWSTTPHTASSTNSTDVEAASSSLTDMTPSISRDSTKGTTSSQLKEPEITQSTNSGVNSTKTTSIESSITLSTGSLSSVSSESKTTGFSTSVSSVPESTELPFSASSGSASHGSTFSSSIGSALNGSTSFTSSGSVFNESISSIPTRPTSTSSTSFASSGSHSTYSVSSVIPTSASNGTTLVSANGSSSAGPTSSTSSGSTFSGSTFPFSSGSTFSESIYPSSSGSTFSRSTFSSSSWSTFNYSSWSTFSWYSYSWTSSTSTISTPISHITQEAKMCHNSFAKGATRVLLNNYAAASALPREGAAECRCTLSLDPRRPNSKTGKFEIIPMYPRSRVSQCGTNTSIETSSGQRFAFKCGPTVWNYKYTGNQANITLYRDADMPPGGYSYMLSFSIFSNSHTMTIACEEFPNPEATKSPTTTGPGRTDERLPLLTSSLRGGFIFDRRAHTGGWTTSTQLSTVTSETDLSTYSMTLSTITTNSQTSRQAGIRKEKSKEATKTSFPYGAVIGACVALSVLLAVLVAITMVCLHRNMKSYRYRAGKTATIQPQTTEQQNFSYVGEEKSPPPGFFSQQSFEPFNNQVFDGKESFNGGVNQSKVTFNGGVNQSKDTFNRGVNQSTDSNEKQNRNSVMAANGLFDILNEQKH